MGCGGGCGAHADCHLHSDGDPHRIPQPLSTSLEASHAHCVFDAHPMGLVDRDGLLDRNQDLDGFHHDHSHIDWFQDCNRLVYDHSHYHGDEDTYCERYRDQVVHLLQDGNSLVHRQQDGDLQWRLHSLVSSFQDFERHSDLVGIPCIFAVSRRNSYILGELSRVQDLQRHLHGDPKLYRQQECIRHPDLHAHHDRVEESIGNLERHVDDARNPQRDCVVPRNSQYAWDAYLHGIGLGQQEPILIGHELPKSLCVGLIVRHGIRNTPRRPHSQLHRNLHRKPQCSRHTYWNSIVFG